MAQSDAGQSPTISASQQLSNISFGNRELIQLNLKRRIEFLRRPEHFYPWWRSCTVNVLIVTDGVLDFSAGL